jgi:hypothetical protein
MDKNLLAWLTNIISSLAISFCFLFNSFHILPLSHIYVVGIFLGCLFLQYLIFRYQPNLSIPDYIKNTQYFVIMTSIFLLIILHIFPNILGYKDLFTNILIILIFLSSILYLISNIDMLQSGPESKSIKHKWVIPLILSGIILNTFILRFENFNETFNVRMNSDKYVSYVPQAEAIYDNKNFFFFKNPAYTKIHEDPSKQYFNEYWEPPFLQWWLSLFIPLKEFLSLEKVIHLAMLSLGSILLVNMFLFFRHISNTYFALIGTFIFSLTPLYGLLTSITTMDMISLIFFFVSIHLYNNNKKRLSTILLSLAVLNKLSFGIIGVAYFATIYIFEKKIASLIGLFITLFTSLILFKIFIAPIPSIYSNIPLVIFNIVIFTIVLYLVAKYSELADKLTVKVPDLRLSIGLFALTLSVALIVLYVWKDNFVNLLPNFFSSGSLLISIPFYEILINRSNTMQSGVLIPILTAMSLLGSALIIRNKVLLSFSIASMTYLIIAGLSIRFAYYYNHLFVILSIAITIHAIYLIYSKQTHVTQRVPLFILLIIIIIVAQLEFKADNKYVFQKHPYLERVDPLIEFILENSKPNEKILTTQTEYITLYMYTRTPFIFITGVRNSPEHPDLNTLRESIVEKGFYASMIDNNIRYIITQNGDDFKSLTYLFDKNIDTNASSRADRVLASIGQQKIETNTQIEDVYAQVKPQNYFSLVKTSGSSAIYEIVPHTQQ